MEEVRGAVVRVAATVAVRVAVAWAAMRAAGAEGWAATGVKVATVEERVEAVRAVGLVVVRGAERGAAERGAGKAAGQAAGKAAGKEGAGKERVVAVKERVVAVKERVAAGKAKAERVAAGKAKAERAVAERAAASAAARVVQRVAMPMRRR